MKRFRIIVLAVLISFLTSCTAGLQQKWDNFDKSDLIGYANVLAKGADWTLSVVNVAATVGCMSGKVPSPACDIYWRLSGGAKIAINGVINASDNYAKNRTEENTAVLTKAIEDLLFYWFKIDALYKTKPEQYGTKLLTF